jgi:hypothetical protein
MTFSGLPAERHIKGVQHHAGLEISREGPAQNLEHFPIKWIPVD